ncbi:MAG TPA: CHAP domain-containing protein [Dongiaceae bacterium]|nr:CHAP domain-containing protein [Dongiaceae bacterium]
MKGVEWRGAARPDGGPGPLGAMVLLLLLAACAGKVAPTTAALPAVPPSAEGIHPYQGDLIQCVPYARQVTGIDISGDAWTWWEAADGRYQRGHQPRFMAVLVLSRTQRLRLGHVAVVVDVQGPRLIRVTHANFGSDPVSRRIIYDSMPVTDVSPDNDWTLVQFWNYQAQAWGILYPAYGFVYPQREGAVAAGPTS